jgi:hypothetical protein
MTDHIKLPPLPSGNVAHLIAAQEAEIERLRAEVEKWKGQHMRDSAELRRLCQHRDEYKARAERLAEALYLIESAKDRGFGIDYARGVAQSVLLYDQEKDHEQ